LTTEDTALDKSLMSTVQQYLAKIEQAGYRLLAHQTSDDQALKITKGEDFGHQGVDGTALFVKSDGIAATVEKMFALHSGDEVGYRSTGGVIHKGSNAVLIMAIPTSSFKGRGTRDLDDHLIDLFGSGVIKTFGVPNQYIVGYWQWDGHFFGNKRFNPKGLL
jgi:predicted transcriptional regulator